MDAIVNRGAGLTEATIDSQSSIGTTIIYFFFLLLLLF